jgi:hypothetical protein
VINGRAHKTEGHKKAREEWMVLIWTEPKKCDTGLRGEYH